MKPLFAFTPSASATVRLLSGDTAQLVRACTAGIPSEHDPISIKDHHSVNAYVARSGRKCYITDIRRRAYTRDYPGLFGLLATAGRRTRSELCLPLFLHGRLVGTLNLESEHVDAYADALHFVQGIAEQIGLSIAHARQTIEDVIWARTTHAAINTHQLLKCTAALEAFALEHKADELSAIVAQMRRAIGGEGVDDIHATDTVDAVLRKVGCDLNLEGHLHWEDWRNTGSELSALQTLALRLAATMILDNAGREAFKSTHFLVSIAGRHHLLGGRPYMRIMIKTSVLNAIPPSIARRLYRVPIRSTGRLHIGAFAAGAAIRAIGGDVFVALNDGRRLHTAIDLPMEA